MGRAIIEVAADPHSAGTPDIQLSTAVIACAEAIWRSGIHRADANDSSIFTRRKPSRLPAQDKAIFLIDIFVVIARRCEKQFTGAAGAKGCEVEGNNRP
jgi:hypothetical protein